ncbi:MAG TPA: hypothetical protein VHA52_10070 [Candidatus Babeliaceae bacterium]|nr:hypothetical protein [Candidatus Babeliaceae bacterium]
MGIGMEGHYLAASVSFVKKPFSFCIVKEDYCLEYTCKDYRVRRPTPNPIHIYAYDSFKCKALESMTIRRENKIEHAAIPIGNNAI